MPSRRRRQSPTPSIPPATPPTAPDPVAQFASLLRESAAREEADRRRRRQAHDDALAAKAAASAHAAALDDARRDLDRAIADVRRARSTRHGVAEADAAWRAAKARVIELETGAAPSWSADAPVDIDESPD